MTISSTAGLDASTRTQIFNALRDGKITKQERTTIGLDDALANQLEKEFSSKKYVQIDDYAIFNKGMEKHDDGKTYLRTRVEQCPSNEKKEPSLLSKAWNKFLDFMTPSNSYYSDNSAVLKMPDDANALTMQNAKVAWNRYVDSENRFIESMSSYSYYQNK